jgi:hypothetical protein
MPLLRDFRPAVVYNEPSVSWFFCSCTSVSLKCTDYVLRCDHAHDLICSPTLQHFATEFSAGPPNQTCYRLQAGVVCTFGLLLKVPSLSIVVSFRRGKKETMRPSRHDSDIQLFTSSGDVQVLDYCKFAG